MTYACVDFHFDSVFQSEMFVNDIDRKNKALASVVEEYWENCSGVIVSSVKFISVILRQKKTSVGLLCVSSLENSTLTYACVNFHFDSVFQSEMFVNDIDRKNKALASVVEEYWENCSGVIVSSVKSISVILRQKKTSVGLLCVSSLENSSENFGPGELSSQLMIFSKVSLLRKYIQSSPFSEYMGTDFGVDILCNTANFCNADHNRFVRHLQKCRTKIQEKDTSIDLFTLAFNSCLSIITCNQVKLYEIAILAICTSIFKPVSNWTLKTSCSTHKIDQQETHG